MAEKRGGFVHRRKKTVAERAETLKPQKHVRNKRGQLKDVDIGGLIGCLTGCTTMEGRFFYKAFCAIIRHELERNRVFYLYKVGYFSVAQPMIPPEYREVGTIRNLKNTKYYQREITFKPVEALRRAKTRKYTPEEISYLAVRPMPGVITENKLPIIDKLEIAKTLRGE